MRTAIGSPTGLDIIRTLVRRNLDLCLIHEPRVRTCVVPARFPSFVREGSIQYEGDLPLHAAAQSLSAAAATSTALHGERPRPSIQTLPGDAVDGASAPICPP